MKLRLFKRLEWAWMGHAKAISSQESLINVLGKLSQPVMSFFC
jgi:hypothetical protein